MPYRAMFATIVTVAFALLALGMWISVIEPVLVSAEKADTVASRPTAGDHPPATRSAPESLQVRRVVQGTLILAFVLICLLLIVGFGATFREWARYTTKHSLRRANKPKTPYIDAWKLAGERMPLAPNAPDEEEPDEE